MDRLSQYNLAGNFIHIGNGEYVPARNIKMVEPLTDEDKAQLAERVPNARRNFQFRVKFWDKTQKLVEELDAAPGTFVRVDENAIIPIANVQCNRVFPYQIESPGFPNQSEYDSSCMLEVEASMHGKTLFA